LRVFPGDKAIPFSPPWSDGHGVEPARFPRQSSEGASSTVHRQAALSMLAPNRAIAVFVNTAAFTSASEDGEGGP
jgi:hypothetical protein